MKKQILIQILSVLIVLLGSFQLVNAKKIVYLGHEYNGKVNNQNIPEGKGKIDIGGLTVEGVFSGKTINEASFNTEWLTYYGTITYDRGNKVTLKQGGKFIKYYYNENDIRTAPAEATTYHQPIIYLSSLQGVKKRSFTENLDADREVDKDSLYKETLKYSNSFEMENVPTELNPPHIDTTIDFPLIKYRLWDNRLNDKEMCAYVVPSEMSKSVNKYKDKQGRIWYYGEAGLLKVKFGKGQPTYYKVIYPNKSQYVSDGSWVVNCSGKYNHVYDAKHKVLLEDNNSLIKNFTGGIELSDFLRYVEAGKTDITLPIGTEILIPYDDRWPNSVYKYKSAEEIEQFINKLLSYYTLGTPFGAKIYYRGRDDNFNASSSDYLGQYENGHYIPKKK